MISRPHYSPCCWVHLWRLRGSAKSTICFDGDSDSDDEMVGLSATMDGQRETMQIPLSMADRCVSPGNHEKSKVCRLSWQFQHHRKRIRMFIKKVAEKGGLVTKKGILVTTRIEVVSMPVPSPTLQHHTFLCQHTVTSLDLNTGDGPASPRSVSRLMMSPPSSYTVDAQAGAERGKMRRHSLPFTSSLPFTAKMTNGVARSRAGSHHDGGTSVLGLEAEWTQCLDRAKVRSSISCGTLESEEKEKEVGGQGVDRVTGKRRVPWGIGGRFGGRLGFGKRVRRMVKAF
ncbi:hypothetical protein E2P81_ATG06376 [Venturia nashicola]|uniref:Uncharacterized protein n=1 Tax=Venturia nashicola TaxID=86259 RepID=A0A4Z1P8J5_9PEZI|nr:hypothetical protein E6O75_ATG06530 [Venturia nashicola]TLD28030.1 hypothetical protein E2P81_ATG06376 [Venturia nashicola]